jgi:hypothetical protein
MRIIETCNYGKDYPDESFLPLPPMSKTGATIVVNAINDAIHVQCPRYWRVVDDDYQLKPGFEP